MMPPPNGADTRPRHLPPLVDEDQRARDLVYDRLAIAAGFLLGIMAACTLITTLPKDGQSCTSKAQCAQVQP